MNVTETRSAILDAESIKRKIRRMALEVAEQNTGESDIVLAGIAGNGETVASCLSEELKKIAGLHTTLITVDMEKRVRGEVTLRPAVDLENKVVILADDVADTGRTLFYALKPFMAFSPKKIQTLVLVERSHKLFPVHTDYTGLSIATTLQEHIIVEAEGESLTGAWLY